MSPSRAFALLSIGLFSAGCAASGHGGFPDTDAGPDATTPIDDDGAIGGGDAQQPPPKTVLYASTNTSLWQIDPSDLKAPLQLVGDYDCIGTGGAVAMTDIAVDKNGTVYGVSQVAAYPLSVQGKVVHCDKTWSLPMGPAFYGLTMAPENTVETTEALIAANDAGELYEILQNGTTRPLGNFGTDKQGKAYALSGDIVFLANGGSPIGFATVRTCTSGCTQVPDTLVQIDVAKMKPGFTGNVVKSVRGVMKQGTNCANVVMPPALGAMYGIAAYQGAVFGFSHAGGIVQINNVDATTCLVSVPQENAANLLFSGAGVTTVAPVIAPPN